MWKRAAPRRDRDVREAMKGVPNFQVHTSPSMIAACLWDQGEDELAERALIMSPDEHGAIQRIEAGTWIRPTRCRSRGSARAADTSSLSPRSPTSREVSGHSRRRAAGRRSYGLHASLQDRPT
jgi:hypothetical protein